MSNKQKEIYKTKKQKTKNINKQTNKQTKKCNEESVIIFHQFFCHQNWINDYDKNDLN